MDRQATLEQTIRDLIRVGNQFWGDFAGQRDNTEMMDAYCEDWEYVRGEALKLLKEEK